MFKNPIFNAVSAYAYILFVATVLNLISKTQGSKPDTFFAPVAALSLLTLSAAIMAYLFFYQPIFLLIDGKKKQSLDFFLKTICSFAAITSILWLLLIAGLI